MVDSPPLQPHATNTKSEWTGRQEVKLVRREIGGRIHLTRSTQEKLYKHGQEKEKSEEEITLIKKCLESNDLLTCLDDQQIDNFIKRCRLLTYEPGETVVRQGEYGDNLYCCTGGVAEVFETMDDLHEPPEGAPAIVEKKIKLGERHTGDSFGQGAIILGRRRSATVVAKTPLTTWAVDLHTFEEEVLFSERVKKLFEVYATMEDPTGQKLMTMDDFVRSCLSGMTDPVKAERILTLMRLLRGDREYIAFKDFVVFNLLMTRPDPEFDIAFMLMDRGHRGYITQSDVVSFIERNRRSEAVAFDMGCDVIRRFFGADGSKRLRVEAFSMFFVQLQTEVAQQAFMKFDAGDGTVGRDDLVTLLSNFRGWQIPPGVIERISKATVGGEARRFNFSEFVAYQNVLSNAPSLVTSISIGCDVKKSPISKDDFKVMSRTLLGARMSRVEADTIFDLFDINRDGYIDGTDCRRVLGEAFIAPLRAIPGRQGRFTFAPPPGTINDQIDQSSTVTPGTSGGFMEGLKGFFSHFMMGAIAGGIGAAAVYPIDLVKTRMQNQRSGASGAAALYKNSLDCFRQTLKNEGVRGLYKGLPPQLVGVAPEKAIKLTVNDLLRDAFTNKDKMGKDHIYLPLEVLAGCGAGASQVVFTNPLEITKIRLQMQGESASIAVRAGKAIPPQLSALQIVRDLGLVGLYRGAGACFLRDIPFSGIYFPAYAAAKRWLSEREGGELKPHHLLIAGAMAGVPAASLTTPADVIKTRLQVVAREGEMTYRGISDCCAHIVRTEGFSALFKGAGMRVSRSSPQFAVTLWAYELLHQAASQAGVAPIQPRPPTNAPVEEVDYMDAFRKAHVSKRLDDIHKLMNNLSNVR